MRIQSLIPALALSLVVATGARAAEKPKEEAKPAAAAVAPAPGPAAGVAVAPAADAAKPVEVPANAPKIVFDKDTIDLGDVIKGEKAQFSFSFKNTGKSDLEVKEAKPSCGCTVADFTRMVKPGESGKVTASIDTSRFKGPITKTVTVTSTDPVNGTVHLTAKANVKALIDVSPSENIYFRVFRGGDEPTKRDVTVTSDAENTFEITKVESTNPIITTNLIDLGKAAKKDAADKAPGGGNFRIEVDLKKDAPIGPVTGVVTVTTTHKKVPTVTLNVSGQVLGQVIVTPQKVYLGQVTKDTAATIKRTVRIERKMPDFKIEKVTSDNPAIKAEVTPVEDGKAYTITISVTGELAAGAISANLTVKTNDKEQTTIEIPVVGTVQG